MTTYVVLAAVRIQQWLTRTPRLALVRGGSHALSALTSHKCPESQAIFNKLAALSFSPCEETPVVAGVVVLESSESVDDLAVARKIHDALAVMVESLPGVEWTAWAAEADSYIQAYTETVGGQRAKYFVRRPPNIRRLPMLAECEGCREESATAQRCYKHEGEADEYVSYGSDCEIRKKFADSKRQPFLCPQGEGETTYESIKEATEFSQLARPEGTLEGAPEENWEREMLLNAVGRRDSENHLALIAADGNQVGNYFKEIHAIGDRETHLKLSKALDCATKQAMYEARKECLKKNRGGRWQYFGETPQYFPDMVHYAGGDDVLVSVAGRFAWIWAITFGSNFSKIFKALVAEAAVELKLSQENVDKLRAASESVSIGIGMVFAHNKAPFAEIYRLASEAEKIAKKETRGKRSAIAWGDFTVESDIKPHHVIEVSKAKSELECCLKSEEGEGRCHDGEHLFWAANLNSSARSALKLALGPNENDIEGVLDWEKRTGNHCVKTRLVEIIAAIRKAEENSTSGPPMTSEEKAHKIGAILLADLDRVRWWPELTETSPTKQGATS